MQEIDRALLLRLWSGLTPNDIKCDECESDDRRKSTDNTA